MLIINLTISKHDDRLSEIMFHSIGDDWFIALFQTKDIEFEKMKNHYTGRDFSETKAEYEGRIFAEFGL